MALTSPLPSSMKAGLALKNEEDFAGAAFWDGGRERRARRARGEHAIRPHGGHQEQAGSLGWAHRGWAGVPDAEGELRRAAGRARARAWPGGAPGLSRGGDSATSPAAGGRGGGCFQGRQLLSASPPWQAAAAGAMALKCLC